MTDKVLRKKKTASICPKTYTLTVECYTPKWKHNKGNIQKSFTVQIADDGKYLYHTV